MSTNKYAPTPENIDKCTKGLVQKFETPVQGIDVSCDSELELTVASNAILLSGSPRSH